MTGAADADRYARRMSAIARLTEDELVGWVWAAEVQDLRRYEEDEEEALTRRAVELFTTIGAVRRRAREEMPRHA